MFQQLICVLLKYLEFCEVLAQRLSLSPPRAFFSPEFGRLSPARLDPCHIGQFVRDPLVAIDARAFPGNKKSSVNISCTPGLLGEIHRYGRVTVPALQRIICLHARPFMLGKLEAHVEELMAG